VQKSDVVKAIFKQHLPTQPAREKGLAFAPTNIALCKYWGKRNAELNLPVTGSLSIALPDKGAMTQLQLFDAEQDFILLNGKSIASDSAFAQRITQFLDLFRPQVKWRLQIDIKMNLPVAAGLASSACGFASLVSALNDLFAWELEKRQLSILARLGSGSAARSLWNGFVEWYAGAQPDGMDSFGEPMPFQWPELNIGIVGISDAPKPISSREAMQRTVNSSALYASWPRKVAQDLVLLKQALNTKNFPLLGGTAESDALSMHATMLSAWPPICYSLPETVSAMQKIWNARAEGLPLYFTQDAGPNLKLIFLEQDKAHVSTLFPTVEIIKIFD